MPDHHARPRPHARGSSAARPRRCLRAAAGGARTHRGSGLPDRVRGPIREPPRWCSCSGLRPPRRRARAAGRRRPRRAHGPAPAGRLWSGEPARGAAAPLPARRSRAQPHAGGAGASAGGRVRGHRRRARACPLQGRASGCVRGAAPPHDARRIRARASWQPQPRDEHAAGHGQPFCRSSGGGARDRSARGAADVRPDEGSRLSLSRLGRRDRRATPGRAVRGAPAAALPQARRCCRGAGAPRAGAARDLRAGPGGLLLAPPRHARARTRGRAAGTRTGFRARAAGARARAGIVGLLAGLLPDRAIAHRSDRRPAGAGALPARAA